MLRTQSIDKNEFFIPGDHFSISCSRKPQNAIFPTTLFFSIDYTTFLIDFNDIMKQMSMQVDEKFKYRQTMLAGSQA